MAKQFNYELLVLCTPSILEKEKKELENFIIKVLESETAKVHHHEFSQLTKLAYKIKGQSEGYYFLVYFDIDANKIKTMEKELFLETKILRHMIVKVEEGYRFKAIDLQITETDKNEREHEDNTINRKKILPRKMIDKQEDKKEPIPSEDVAEQTTAKKKKDSKLKKKESLDEKIESLDEKLAKIVADPDSLGL
ncbi:MAG: 30S ribosomal protein S6, small subunit ribosomal protein S6 [Candidatus Peregrinibacteria bacterium GW2011_GWF2_33_10]|nr:MAG: 30S ribosomal protein S6, small subunit ribosomal protein S6 [Candidatus Peregrinibacteria bacterium GW2011_GWF2_33_10]OGJ44948.1 MAG: 30S ribosomal protein S6 [Candidatus Peregrinibacteria bacterium RIFOXYA12_FULL_33_12]OGJ45246.1 MAG: 30S ribosomal protein S6 [Candidatus Peregrinibacteria bacterium RIFOXYA2_FULL_33_21]OGJ51170.1 MAG: 30S ribosomal protein S6 [Candidatus Peregrinibacteria bacterium RIFOXYB2_FULL_33_20]